VLEEVRKACTVRSLIGRAHVVPEVESDDRHAVVRVHDDAKTVVQAFLE
jgi:hypothetical protein